MVLKFPAQLALPASIIVKRGISESDQKDAIDAANKFRRENAEEKHIANMNELTYDVELEKIADEASKCKNSSEYGIWWFSNFDSVYVSTNVNYKTMGCTKAPKDCKITLNNWRYTVRGGEYVCVLGPHVKDIKHSTMITGKPGSKCPEETVSIDGLCGSSGGYFVNFNLLILFLSIFYELM